MAEPAIQRSEHSANGIGPGDINTVFPYKVCINLDRRFDRWKQIEQKFRHYDIRDVRRVSAVEGQGLTVPEGWTSTPGAYGCLLSHLQIVSEARQLGLPNVLIFEDDAAFDDRLPSHFSAYFEQLPRDWDMLHLGAMHMDEPIEITANVHKIRRAHSTFAYALNHTIFDAFIELNSNALKAVDLNNLTLQNEHECYCFLPHLVWVENVHSDAQVRQKDHWYLKESLVMYGTRMNQILRETTVVIAYQNPTRSEHARRNLLFLARFYAARLSGISVLVVEQDAESTLTPADLPEGCRYFLDRDATPLNHARCFNAGLRLADPGHSFFIFSNSDIFVEEWDIRANLRMCERVDCTTGFRKSVELNETASAKLGENNPMLLTPWFDARDYPESRKRDPFGGICFFTRRGIEGAGGWNEASSPLSLVNPSEPRVFDSPNDALRLLGA